MSSRLEIMMACHYTSVVSPYAKDDPEHRWSRAVSEIHSRWLSRGYIKIADAALTAQYGTEYEATDALRVYTETLMKVLMPRRVERWEVPTSWENT